MLIALSGIHGIGKTTFVNNYSSDRPLLKVVDIDIVEPQKEKRKEQLYRLKLFEDLFEKLDKCKKDILIDRSPLDFVVYNNWWLEESDIEVFNKKFKKTIDRYKKMDPINVLVYDKPEKVWERVLKRARGKYDEANKEYFDFCYEAFYKDRGETFEKMSGVKTKLVHLNDLEKEINTILNS